MRLVQITDSHLHADISARSRAGVPWQHFQRVLAAAAAKRPDIIVFTGDVSQDETPASYALVKEAMASLPCPWFWLPGNHDQIELMRAEHPLLKEVDMQQWRMLLLNTQVAGQPYGELGCEQLLRLTAQLEEDDRPTLIAMHHPPVDVGAEWMDAIGLKDREAFWQVLSAYPHVKAVLFGHAHQAHAQHFAFAENRIGVYGCPAMSDQFMPGAASFAIDEASRPGYRVVDLQGEQWETWIERVDV
ncbi:metallophosphoesterase [Vreelandella nanhaiensis]|uniref:Phosphodiesterase n=1 Tax=Vreelandella nanhaiensis TaxID=1258546 RepID=A0A433KGN1_9GAMM|nr:metallophosphoesterase [Halomonas nanhaiensis]RUR28116.1 phosphodiesterase [Halomonas nanhaiensis]